MGFETLSDKSIDAAFNNMQKKPAINEAEVKEYSKRIANAIKNGDAGPSMKNNSTIVFQIEDFGLKAANSSPEQGYELVNAYLLKTYGSAKSKITMVQEQGKISVEMTNVEVYNKNDLFLYNPFQASKAKEIIEDAKKASGGKQASVTKDYEKDLDGSNNNYLPRTKSKDIQIA